MVNVIQSVVFHFFPAFRLEWFALLPAIALVFVGLFVETQYTSKLNFFLNSITLLSYFGVKNNVDQIVGIVILTFAFLTTYSFVAHFSNKQIPVMTWYEDAINKYSIIRKFGGSLVVGAVIFFDSISA